jgi:hypothetical protein
MSVAEYLEEYFETDVIKAALSGSGIIGTGLGPYSPGTAYVLLHHYMGEVDGSIGSWGFARGGMGSIANALADAFKDHDGELLTDAEVSQIIVKRGRAKGVALSNGDEYYAKNTPRQKHTISMEGGSKKTQYFLSAGYYNMHGLLKLGYDSYDRYNVMANVTSQVADWIRIDFKT